MFAIQGTSAKLTVGNGVIPWSGRDPGQRRTCCHDKHTKKIYDAGNRYPSNVGWSGWESGPTASETGVSIPCIVNFFRVFAMTAWMPLSKVSAESRNNSVAHRQLCGGALDCKHTNKQYRKTYEAQTHGVMRLRGYGIDGLRGYVRKLFEKFQALHGDGEINGSSIYWQVYGDYFLGCPWHIRNRLP